MNLEQLNQLYERIRGYLHTEPWTVLVELAVIWIVVYFVWRFLRGTRGARVVKGVAIVLAAAWLTIELLGRSGAFERLYYLYGSFLGLIALMLVIVFQPELRRALVRLGEARLFRQSGLRRARIVEQVLAATEYLSRNKIGALVAFERHIGLQGVVELGTRIDGEVTKELLMTIFWPGSALHDMGVVIRGDRVIAAGVQFPLAEGEHIPQELGSRHRAALGLSHETDALVLVVSEETGIISVAERGELSRGLSVEQLRPVLTRGLGSVSIPDRSEPALSGNDNGNTVTGDGDLSIRQ